MTRPRICTSDKSPKSQLCEWRGETKSYSVHLCSAPNVPRGPLGWQSAVETQAMKVWNFACGCMYVTSKIGFLRIRRFRSFCGKLAEDRVRRAGTFRLPTLRIREVVGPFRKLLRLPRRRAWRSVESASVLTAPCRTPLQHNSNQSAKRKRLTIYLLHWTKTKPTSSIHISSIYPYSSVHSPQLFNRSAQSKVRSVVLPSALAIIVGVRQGQTRNGTSHVRPNTSPKRDLEEEPVETRIFAVPVNARW